MSNAPINRPLALNQVLEEEYERLHGDPPPSVEKLKKKKRAPDEDERHGGESPSNPGKKSRSELRLEAVFKDIHRKKQSAICLSGGGIRSATFALGVLQGLARRDLLDKFSYLSTVSGGGYVGGWLSAWIHRHKEGVRGVIRDLKETSEAKTKIEPEPEPVQHLRSYSNYLTPRLGIFSADTWTVAAIILRNLILNWLVLIPMLILVLVIPRLAVASIHNIPSTSGSFILYLALAVLTFIVILLFIWKRSFPMWGALLLMAAYIILVIALWYWPLATTLLIGFAGGVMCITYVGLKRPSSTTDYNNQTRFLQFCLLPLLTSAVALTTFWAWFCHASVPVQEQLENLRLQLPAWTGLAGIKNPHYSVPFIVFGLLLYLTGWLIYSFWLGHLSFWKRGWRDRVDNHKVFEFFAMLVSGVIGGVFLWLIATKVFPEPVASRDTSDVILYYVSFASPLYLLLFLLTAILFAGISSEYTADEDREWWARFSAWILISITVWSAVSYLSLLGPYLFDYISAKYIVPAGGLVGFLTTKLAQSAKSPANLKEEKKGGLMGMVMSYALPLGALLTIALLIVLLTYGINYLLAILTLIFGALSWETIIGTKLMGDFWLLTQPSMPHGNLSSLDHMNIIRRVSFRLLVVLVVVIAVLGHRLWHLINTNKFSHHAMYRNRLIRAYLGASNEKRVPNPFTGFDTNDNVPMYQLRREFFHPESFKDIGALALRLKNQEDAISIYFWDKRLSKMTLQHLEKCYKGRSVSQLLQQALIKDLNKSILKTDSLYDDTPAFSMIEKAKKLAEDYKSKPNTPDRLVLLNRRLIEAAFPAEIYPCPEPHKPLPVVNMTLNLVHGQKLAWQDRKAASFTVTPLHSGSCQIPDFEEEDDDRKLTAQGKLKVYGSYRNSQEYGGADSGGISLGTAVAISGAAVSPNMGYYSSTLVTFLMTLFNVRLGWWLGNPGKAGKDYYTVANPKSSAYPIVAEALGLTDSDNSYVYLSDGGHFENLGIYEMVLRRCHTIVVSDASDDFEFQFDNLGNAIRKIRVDFGIPIEFEPMSIYPRSKGKPGAFCAIGHIKYSAVDLVDKYDWQDHLLEDEKGNPQQQPAPDGLLIYIKPVFYGDEPRDIYHYGQANDRFPHESTADQWFSEEQFESYRSLGLYIVDKILGQKEKPAAVGEKAPPMKFEEFVRTAQQHVKDFENLPKS